ncbi:MAG: putative alpha/beta superfamily hydrolase [Cyclobacteriaceae bacterium]|jgi:predicted alpha/beta superfamily hydrolase
MYKYIILTCSLLAGIHSLCAQGEDQIMIGTEYMYSSEILNEERAYWVSLPESYSETTSSYKTYPILIVLDGHAHFKPVVGMVNYMSTGYNGNRKIPEMIVVGIQNVNRNRDFTPDKIITTRANVYGGGDKFLSFLEEELIPALDQQYRTVPYRILFGHSLGGLLAAHTFMKDQTLFNAFISVDPSFGNWDAAMMDQKLDAVTEKSFDRFIYLATANWGKRNIRNRDRHVRFYEALNNKSPSKFPGTYEYFENEDHGSVPIIAFHNGISSIFQGYDISYRDVDHTAQLIDHFKEISERLSWEFVPPEALVNRVGYRILRSKNKEDQATAISFFSMNTENYADSFNAFDSLGEAYEAVDNIDKAISSYEKSLALNPENQHASARISSLKKVK